MKLQKTRGFRYTGHRHHYVVAYDYSSGRKERFTVYKISYASSRATIVGRELLISSVKKVIETHERKTCQRLGISPFRSMEDYHKEQIKKYGRWEE